MSGTTSHIFKVVEYTGDAADAIPRVFITLLSRIINDFPFPGDSTTTHGVNHVYQRVYQHITQKEGDAGMTRFAQLNYLTKGSIKGSWSMKSKKKLEDQFVGWAESEVTLFSFRGIRMQATNEAQQVKIAVLSMLRGEIDNLLYCWIDNTKVQACSQLVKQLLGIQQPTLTSRKRQHNDTTCCICFGDLNIDNMMVWACHHAFCAGCSTRLFAQEPRCPVCRKRTNQEPHKVYA